MSDPYESSGSKPPPGAGFPPPSGERHPAVSAPPPPSTGPAVEWGPGRTLAALAILIVVLGVEAAVVAGIFDPDLNTLDSRLVLQAALAATLVAVAFVAAKPGEGMAGPAALGLRRPLRRAVGSSVLAYLAYVACALALAALLAPEQEDVTRDLGADEGPIGAVIAGILVIGVAPLTEEIFFRGFLFAGMRRSLPFILAAAISAGIWGLFHYTGPGSWGVVLQLSIFGVILSWLYQRTGSIWPTIAVHAFNNALAFALLTS